MKTFIEQARVFAAYHQKPITKYLHFAGVPLIILSMMIFLGFFRLVITNVWETNFAAIGAVVLLIYYFRLHWQLALALTPIIIFLLWIASFFSYAGPTTMGLWAFILCFILGWGLLLAGHFMEGRQPSFSEIVQQALIAPLALTAELFFMANLMPELKKDIHIIEMPKENIHKEEVVVTPKRRPKL